jgi:hypothetical protein
MYHVWLDAPTGNVVYGDKTTATLVCRAQYGIRNIMSRETCRVYWFRESFDVTPATVGELGWEKDDYGKTWYDYGGPGWMPIAEMNRMTVGGFHEDFNVLTVPLHQVPWRWRFKCVVYYNDKNICGGKATEYIWNLDSQYDLEL